MPGPARRTVRSLSVPLDVIDETRAHTRSTVNDVVLAITGGALRRYLRRRHALPVAPLVAMVPMSLRDGDGNAGGNQTSALFTTLGTDIADPSRRLAEVDPRARRWPSAATTTPASARSSSSSDLVPPRAGQGIARLAGRLGLAGWGPLAFNVVVSNVAGPDVPFYCNGALVESAFPMGPVTDWSPLNVTVVSYRHQLAFGVVACPDVVRQVDVLMDDFRLEVEALRVAGRPPRRSLVGQLTGCARLAGRGLCTACAVDDAQNRHPVAARARRIATRRPPGCVDAPSHLGEPRPRTPMRMIGTWSPRPPPGSPTPHAP